MSELRKLVLACATAVLCQLSACEVWAEASSSGAEVKNSIAPMDAEFAVALHEYLSGNVTNAYKRLDAAIESLQPTGPWYLYLPLFRTCFDKMTEAPVPYEHSKNGKDIIAGIASSARESPSALVKLIVLTPTRKVPNDEGVYEYIRTMEVRYGDSPWSEWAKWKKTEMDLSRLELGVLKAYPLGGSSVANAAMSCQMKCLLEANRNHGNGFMDRWMTFYLERGIAYDLVVLEGRLSECNEDGLKRRDALEKIRKARPGWVDIESDVLEIVSDSYVGDPADVVCVYFESERKNVASFPATIPASKEELRQSYRRSVKSK